MSIVNYPFAIVHGVSIALMRTLDGERLTLEPQIEAHAEEMFAVLSDPALYEYEGEPPVSLAWLRERFCWLERRRSPDGTEGWLNWVVRLKESRAAIGYVQATLRAEHTAAIAYMLHSAQWGKGLAREAVEAMTAGLVGRHGVRTLTAVLKAQNFRSLRLLERLGFTPAPAAGGPGFGVIEPGERAMIRRLP